MVTRWAIFILPILGLLWIPVRLRGNLLLDKTLIQMFAGYSRLDSVPERTHLVSGCQELGFS
jgi:hypothetical protein